MCNHEVTQAEYEKYCFYGGQAPDEEDDKDKYPAYNINWYDAIVYCNLRSIAENLTPVYSVFKAGSTEKSTIPAEWDGIRSQHEGEDTKYCGPDAETSSWNWAASNPGYDKIDINPNANGYRMPTSKEWEYAARGGNGLEGEQTQYSGSNDYSAVAVDSYDNIQEIRSKQPNGLGIYDMSGSVSEWFFDVYGEDYRGMSPTSSSEYIDYSYGVYPQTRQNSDVKQGFRVVRNVPAAPLSWMIEDNNGHYYVDLGLSTLWATTNVGADNPQDKGTAIQWSENIGGSWGTDWEAPTQQQFAELDECNMEYVDSYAGTGKKGIVVYGKNNSSQSLDSPHIFIPYDTDINGNYWTSSAGNESGTAKVVIFTYSEGGHGGTVSVVGASDTQSIEQAYENEHVVRLVRK